MAYRKLPSVFIRSEREKNRSRAPPEQCVIKPQQKRKSQIINFSPSSKQPTIRMKNELAEAKQKLRMCMHLWRCKDMHDAHAHLGNSNNQSAKCCSRHTHIHTWTRNTRGPREPPDECICIVSGIGRRKKWIRKRNAMIWSRHALFISGDDGWCVKFEMRVRREEKARNNWILLSMRDVCIR